MQSDPQSHRRVRSILFAAAVAAMATCAAQAQIVNGTIEDNEYNLNLATQTNPTGYGDNASELDRAVGRWMSDGSFKLGIAGNLEGNGNGVVIFFDTKAGGAVVSTSPAGYGRLGSVAGEGFTHRTAQWGNDTDATAANSNGLGSVLSPGFNPDYSLEINQNGTSHF